MLKGVLFIIVLVFIFMAIGVMLIYRAVSHGIRHFKQMMGMDDTEDTSNRHNRNYTGKRQQQYQFHHGGTQKGASQDSYSSQQQPNQNSGETIIDQRDNSQTQKKIFSDDEGEYVDYVEEK